MSNTFFPLPVNHNTNNAWGNPTLANLKFGVPDLTCYLYDNGGVLTLSTGWIGIDDGTVKGVSEIDTVTTIDISGLSHGATGIWGEIYMTVSGTTPSFAAVDIAGATTETTIPTDFTGAFDREKGGYYIDSSRRCIGIVWKTSGSVLSHIINADYNRITSRLAAVNAYGLALLDDGGNEALRVEDGGHTNFKKSIGLSGVLTITSDEDDLDVTGVSVLICDTASGNIVLGGLKNGVVNQLLYVVKNKFQNTLTIEHAEGVGSQDIYTYDANDIVLTSRGGTTLIFGGTNWLEINYA